MPVVEHAGVKVAVDDEGYLVNSDDWNEEIAAALAAREGVPDLNGAWMEIIKFMRSYYRAYNAFPILRAVCRNVHMSKECFSEKFIDPLKAWKIAGLPKPDEHVIADIRGEGGVA
jgi:tRNA 2-thiouridine synthesizing protein E